MITYYPDKIKWDKLLAKNNASVFSTIEWANSCANHEFKPIYVVDNNYTKGMVFMQRNDKRAYDSMIGGGYGGYIGKPIDFSSLIISSLNYIRIIDYFKTLKEEGWDRKDVATYIITLKDFKPSHGIKDNIRVANKNNITIEETDNIKLFHDTYAKCYENFEIGSQYNQEYFQRIKDNMGSMAKFYLMKQGRKVIGMSLQLFFKKEIFNLYNACLDKYKRTGCISLLMWKVIEENKDKYDTYNLGAATTEGAHNFKNNWGAVRYDYPIYGKVINTIYKKIADTGG